MCMGYMTYFYTTSDFSCQVKKRRFVQVVLLSTFLDGKFHDMLDLLQVIITVATNAYI
jgi:hypothetical protein